MAGEARAWKLLRTQMARLGMDAVRVENPALPGTPDVNFIEGWTELKAASRWPPRGGPLRLDHPPTQEQKAWLYRRWNNGGWATLTLSVGTRHEREWMIFRGGDVISIWREPPTKDQLESRSILRTSQADEVARFLKEAHQWEL